MVDSSTNFKLNTKHSIDFDKLAKDSSESLIKKISHFVPEIEQLNSIFKARLENCGYDTDICYMITDAITNLGTAVCTLLNFWEEDINEQ